MKAIYNLPHRSLQGFLSSILFFHGVELKSPHYSLFCKRAKESAASLPKLSKRKPMEIAIDSLGLKISSYKPLKGHTNEKIDKLAIQINDLVVTDTAFRKCARYGISLKKT